MKRKFKMTRNVVRSKKRRNSRSGANSNTSNSHFMRDKNNKTKVVKKFIFEKEISLQEFADISKIPLIEIIKFFFNEQKLLNVNNILSKDDVRLICEHLNIKFEDKSTKSNKKTTFLDDLNAEENKSLKFEPRCPIVTVMGHIDHGKTSLLDYIKKTNVVANEFGQITQHLAAYTINFNKNKLTFIDTPGHLAFSNMRSQGSQVTDIVLLIVAADDGVKEQTIEAIDHARAANVPIIVVINKIDLPAANIENVYQQLADLDLTPEDWNGSTICVPISVKQGKNIDALMETILSLSEILELSAPKDCLASGAILESYQNKKIGNFATVIVQQGTLKKGDIGIFGNFISKFRIFVDEYNNPIEEALPGTVAVLGGLPSLPNSGDTFKIYKNLKEAKSALSNFISKIEELKHTSFSQVISDINNVDQKYINVVIKSDVTGTAIALKDHLKEIAIDDHRVNVLRFSAGQITEDDVLLASSSNAVIIAFNIGVQKNIAKIMEEQNVLVNFSNVIYGAEDFLTDCLKAKSLPDQKEEYIGTAEVKAIFDISGSKNNKVAGCALKEGFIDIAYPIRYYRNNEQIYEGTIYSLKHLKSNVKRVKNRQEFGVIFKFFNDYQVGDVIRGYHKIKIKK